MKEILIAAKIAGIIVVALFVFDLVIETSGILGLAIVAFLAATFMVWLFRKGL